MAKVPDDVFFLGIRELNGRLVSREFSAVELTRAFCDRLEALGPQYNAVALSLRRDALRKARDVDDELKRGRTRGPLQGIPYGVKDLLAAKGGPTTWGARPYAGQVFDYNAHVIDKLEKAGAILIAKLAMIELAGGGGYRSASASLTGPCRNPWDRTRWAGGSSSGSGAATAAGLVTFALGSETSGSILTPSAYCGITGFRPTYGLVSRHGAMALSWTLDKLGPMCRSAEDCALVLETIAGKDEADPGSAGKSFYYTPKFWREPAELTIGYAAVDFEEWAEEPARPAFREALGVVKSLGYQMKEVELPDFPYGALVSTIYNSEGASAFEDLITSGRVNELADKSQAAGLKASLEIPAIQYLKAQRIRSEVQLGLRQLFDSVDLLMAPSRLTVASKISDPVTGSASANRPPPASRGLSGLIAAGNLAGVPAISIPCGFVDKLPIGLSFVARPFAENLIFAAAEGFQAQTAWHRRHPDIAPTSGV